MLLTGAEANEVFFRASDDELDQAAAYPFMTPVFGEGVVFDASPEERRRALHNQSLRDKFMRGHAATITGSAVFEQFVADHGVPVVAAGFEPLKGSLGATGHFSCDAWYAKAL